MSVGVKICGLKTEAAVTAVIAGGAAFAGFVFFEKSPRFIAPDAAGALRADLPKTIPAVAVTADADDAALDAIIEGMRPDYLQLHGAESPARVAALKARTGLKIIKAIPVAGRDDLAALADFDKVADLLLFDAKPSVGDALPGGNARRFDWGLLAGVPTRAPFMLAGGLTADTLREAVMRSGAGFVDVSSGVERAPGEKDVGLIAAFLGAAQAL